MPTEVFARTTLVEGMHFHSENQQGLGAEFDSRPAGEPIAGATPMEIVLQAAGGCSLMDVTFILRKRRIPPERLEIEIKGVKRDAHPKIYETIEATYRAKGAGLTLEELEKAANLSMTTYCSVFGMLQQVAKVTWKCEIIE